MFNSSSALSPADVMALGNGNDGWGNGSWLWFLIVIFALFGGWGNGFGGNNGTVQGYTLASDFANLQRQIDSQTADIKSSLVSIGNGISSLGYDQLSQMNGINTNIYQSTNTLESAINNCCCNNREGFANVNYNLASQANGITNAINSGFCQTNYNAQTNTRDIVDSQNAGTQAILAKLSAMEASAKDDKIATLTAMNSDLRFQASQAAQNTFIQNLVKPPIQPCYVTQNPYCSCGNAYNSYLYGTTVS